MAEPERQAGTVGTGVSRNKAHYSFKAKHIYIIMCTCTHAHAHTNSHSLGQQYAKQPSSPDKLENKDLGVEIASHSCSASYSHGLE